VSWQRALFAEISARLPAGADPELSGSANSTDQVLDGWSDLDLHLRLDEPLTLTEVVGQVWAYEAVWAYGVEEDSGQVVRTVLADGRRVDLSVSGTGRLVGPELPANDFRFVAAQAVTKLGRGDRLIGLHLFYDLLRRCLVEAMLLRDRDLGTTVHRTGSARDVLVAEVLEIARMPLALAPRPNLVDTAAACYDRWHTEVDPAYQADWSGLDALLSRGLSTS
jgi:hypothetical protein